MVIYVMKHGAYIAAVNLEIVDELMEGALDEELLPDATCSVVRVNKFKEDL
jgi:hypothetical protein